MLKKSKIKWETHNHNAPDHPYPHSHSFRTFSRATLSHPFFFRFSQMWKIAIMGTAMSPCRRRNQAWYSSLKINWSNFVIRKNSGDNQVVGVKSGSGQADPGRRDERGHGRVGRLQGVLQQVRHALHWRLLALEHFPQLVLYRRESVACRLVQWCQVDQGDLIDWLIKTLILINKVIILIFVLIT